MGNEEHRDLIEKSGAEYRQCNIRILEEGQNLNNQSGNPDVNSIMGKYMSTADEMTPKYLKIIEEENIDLIIHDFGAVWVRWFLEYMNNLHASGKISRKPPVSVMFSPCFLFEKGLYPNKAEAEYLPTPRIGLVSGFNMLRFLFSYYFFLRRWGLKFVNPMDLIVFQRDEHNICCVIPEFQPRSHLFKSINFVGNCASKLVFKLCFPVFKREL